MHQIDTMVNEWQSVLCSVFTARRYASAIYAMVVCLSVCRSQVGVLLNGHNMTIAVQWLVFTARCYASAVLAMALCPSVSVTSRCSIETAERIELVFGMWASFQPSYTVLKGNSVISKNKGTSLRSFVLNSGLRKFRHGISIVEACYQLSSRKVDAQSVINWAVVGQLSR